MKRTRSSLCAVAASLALFLTACGAEQEAVHSAPEGSAPATDAASTDVSSPDVPGSQSSSTTAPPPPSEQPGDVVAPSVATVEVLRTPEGYELWDEAPLEGFYPLLRGDNGCTLEYRTIQAGVEDGELTNDALSRRSATDLLRIFAGPDPALTEIALPIDGNELFSYPFWTGSAPTTEGYTLTVASSMTPVQMDDRTEAWGLDFVMYCPEGVDAAAEFQTVMKDVQPYVFIDPAFDS